MKLLVFFVFVFLAPIAFSFAQIQIAEIMYNPDGNDDGREWIEAINLGSPMQIKTGRDGWKINDGKNHYLQTQDAENDKSFSAPKNKFSAFNWNTNEVIVFTEDKNKFLKDYPGADYKIIESSFYLKNSGGEIKILDENKNTMTTSAYQNIANEGYSIIYKNGQWIQGVNKGTPGIYPESNIGSQDIGIRVYESAENKILPIKNKQTLAPTTVQTATAPAVIFTANHQQATISSPSIPDTRSPPPVLLINEFLPNTEGKDDNEFIELLNERESVVNLSNFSIKIGDKKIKLSGESASKYIILWKQYYNFNIRNKGETLILFYNDKEIHKISYSGKSSEDKSFSKIGNEWVWTKPTPGEENILIKNQISNIKYQKNDSVLKNNENNTIFQEESITEFTGNIQENVKSANNYKNINPAILGVFVAIILALIAVLILR